MLVDKEFQQFLNDFGDELVMKAKQGVDSGKLKSSIKANVTGDDLDIIMEDYGMFQDKGVSGTKIKYNTEFSYGSKMPNISSLAKWAKKENLTLKNGMTYQSLGYVLARSIQRKGIKPTLFLTKPFEKMWVDIDMETFFDDVMNKFDKEINN